MLFRSLLHCARIGVDPESLLPDANADMKAQEEKLKTILPVEEKLKTMGIREDHLLLPAPIQRCYNENSELFLRVRKLHEALKLMDAAKPCDRFPYVSELLSLDDQISKNWKTYDSYEIETVAVPVVESVIDAKRISANRKYLSDNKEKLANLLAENSPKAEALRNKMQIRVDELLAANAGISEEQLTELSKLGINV